VQRRDLRCIYAHIEGNKGKTNGKFAASINFSRMQYFQKVRLKERRKQDILQKSESLIVRTALKQIVKLSLFKRLTE
jgi:hypothetical protein